MQLSGLDVALYGFNSYKRKIEPAGISYELRIIRDRLTLGLSTEPILKQAAVVDFISEQWTTNLDAEADATDAALEFMDPDDEQYAIFLHTLDPKHWKEQDHYKVLGLSKLRWQATVLQIRTAYRAKVLKHHPDKNKSGNNKVNGSEDCFTCINKAYEQLGLSLQKRRAYDSVDPKFDDSIPDEKKINSKNFFDTLQPVFLRNARWSLRQPVPSLGDSNSTEDEVDRFYSFWFHWDSWREFSYLDEEDREKGEDRWERREIDKFNKIERERKRKNEMKRIRSLVEMAYNKDPRVAVFKERNRLKKEKQRDERRKALEEKRAEDERKRMEIELQTKQAEEVQLEKERQQLALEKRLKEQQKKQLGDARRKLRRTAESKNYWNADASTRLSCLEAIEHVCLRFDADHLNEITARVECVNSLTEAMAVLSIQVSEENLENIENKGEASEDTTDGDCRWSADEIALLVKATTLYPAGTVKRWSEIANYVNEHRENRDAKKKTEKDILLEAKMLKSLNNVQDQKRVKDILNSAKASETEWTTEEQKLLETALKKFPPSDPSRWDNIGNFVGKSKKDCIKRFKYLVEVVKNKREQSS